MVKVLYLWPAGKVRAFTCSLLIQTVIFVAPKIFYYYEFAELIAFFRDYGYRKFLIIHEFLEKLY